MTEFHRAVIVIAIFERKLLRQSLTRGLDIESANPPVPPTEEQNAVSRDEVETDQPSARGPSHGAPLPHQSLHEAGLSVATGAPKGRGHQEQQGGVRAAQAHTRADAAAESASRAAEHRTTDEAGSVREEARGGTAGSDECAESTKDRGAAEEGPSSSRGAEGDRGEASGSTQARCADKPRKKKSQKKGAVPKASRDVDAVEAHDERRATPREDADDGGHVAAVPQPDDGESRRTAVRLVPLAREESAPPPRSVVRMTAGVGLSSRLPVRGRVVVKETGGSMGEPGQDGSAAGGTVSTTHVLGKREVRNNAAASGRVHSAAIDDVMTTAVHSASERSRNAAIDVVAMSASHVAPVRPARKPRVKVDQVEYSVAWRDV